MKKLLQSVLTFDGEQEWFENSVRINNETMSYGYLICLHWELLKESGHGKICFIYTLGGQDAVFNT